jgi:hypothetical protein
MDGQNNYHIARCTNELKALVPGTCPSYSLCFFVIVVPRVRQAVEAVGVHDQAGERAPAVAVGHQILVGEHRRCELPSLTVLHRERIEAVPSGVVKLLAPLRNGLVGNDK